MYWGGALATDPGLEGAPIVINFGNKVLTAGNTHIYTLGFNVTLNLEPGSADGGDNVYTACELQATDQDDQQQSTKQIWIGRQHICRR